MNGPYGVEPTDDDLYDGEPTDADADADEEYKDSFSWFAEHGDGFPHFIVRAEEREPTDWTGPARELGVDKDELATILGPAPYYMYEAGFVLGLEEPRVFLDYVFSDMTGSDNLSVAVAAAVGELTGMQLSAKVLVGKVAAGWDHHQMYYELGESRTVIKRERYPQEKDFLAAIGRAVRNARKSRMAEKWVCNRCGVTGFNEDMCFQCGDPAETVCEPCAGKYYDIQIVY